MNSSEQQRDDSPTCSCGSQPPSNSRQLTTAEANVSVANSTGRTALHTAVAHGNSLTQQLVAAGAALGALDGTNPLSKQPSGTALHIAAVKENTVITATLLAAGASVYIGNQYGSTPSLFAARLSHIAVVSQLLASGAAVNVANQYGCTPLLTAAKHGHTFIVQQLIAAGADVNAIDCQRHGDTALSYLLAHEHVDQAAVQQLLGAGGNPNVPSVEGHTALHHAIGQQHNGIIPILLAAGADPQGLIHCCTVTLIVDT